MKNEVKKEIEELIEIYELNCSIREFQDKIDWDMISCYQELSLDFIEEFQDKVYWTNISYHQELSLDFIKEFKDRLEIKEMLLRDKITQKFYDELTTPIPVSRWELLDI